jgi:hypothetical protein
VVAVAVALFGTTFLWLMPSFQDDAVAGDGGRWTVVQLLVVSTVVGFAAAAWALHRALAWWRPAAIAAAVVGLAVLPIWWVAVSDVAGATNVAANLAVHAVGSAVVLASLLVPRLDDRVERRLHVHG